MASIKIKKTRSGSKGSGPKVGVLISRTADEEVAEGRIKVIQRKKTLVFNGSARTKGDLKPVSIRPIAYKGVFFGADIAHSTILHGSISPIVEQAKQAASRSGRLIEGPSIKDYAKNLLNRSVSKVNESLKSSS